MTQKKVCAIVGVGPGNGAAYARRFAREGYAVALIARSTGYSESLLEELPAGGRAYACDAADPDALAQTFARIAAELGEVETLLYNAGSGGVWNTIEETDLSYFEQAWRVNALGLAAATQAVVPAMKAKGSGAIIVTGATASRRGGANAASVAQAKAAQRTLAESMARHLWPHGIHVALIILDGVVDLERTRLRFPEKPDAFFVKADDVAETAWALTRQSPSAWSFEVEARPFAEKW